MKRMLFSLALLVVVEKSFSQTPEFTKDYYLSKSKSQKTIGWVMLGGGVAMATAGILIVNKNDDDLLDNLGNTGAGMILEIAGIATALGSIPFFISSAKNIRKAAFISLNNQQILIPQQNSFALTTQPALLLKIEL